MNTVGVASQRDVDAIIDNQFAVMRPGRRPRVLGELEKINRRQRFDSQLQNAHAGFQEPSQNPLGGTTAGLLGIEYGVERRQFQGHGSRGFLLKLDTQVGNFFSQRISIDAENLRGTYLIAFGFF
jgi:hypothetical protein